MDAKRLVFLCSIFLFFAMSTAVVAETAQSPSDQPHSQLSLHHSQASETTATEDRPIVERAEIEFAANSTDTIEATFVYEIPDDVPELEFSVALFDFELIETDSFTQTGERTFQWTGESNSGSVTIQYPAETGFYLDERHQRAVGGTDEWAIVVRPETEASWSHFGADPGISFQFEVSGDGTAGQDLAYLGEFDTRETVVSGETIRLIIPEAANPASPIDAIEESIEETAAMEFANRNTAVTTFVAPSGEIDWQPRGLAVGPDIRVDDSVAVDLPVNIWAHEYVHTRQKQETTTAETMWLIEGAADYYGALVNLELGHHEFPDFVDVLQRGHDTQVTDEVLTEPGSWTTTDGDYLKGALVVGVLDYEIRNVTDGNATFVNVIQEWNRVTEFNQTAFLDGIEEIAGPEVRDLAETYTTTDATPEVWSEEDHNTTFLVNGSAIPEQDRPAFVTEDQTDSEEQSRDTDTETADQPTTTDETDETETADTGADDQSEDDMFGVGFGVAIAIVALAILSSMGRRTRE